MDSTEDGYNRSDLLNLPNTKKKQLYKAKKRQFTIITTKIALLYSLCFSYAEQYTEYFWESKGKDIRHEYGGWAECKDVLLDTSS